MKLFNFVKTSLALTAFTVLSSALLESAEAAIIVGGISFDDKAFADSIISTNSSRSAFPPGSTLQDGLLGSNINSHLDTQPGDFFELGFEDNSVFNGLGNDLAVFDISDDTDPFDVSLTVGGQSFSVPRSGFSIVGTNSFGFPLRVAFVDLDDLGVPANVKLNSIVFATPRSSVEFAAFGALNSIPKTKSVPEPTSILSLLSICAVGVGSMVFKQKNV